MVQDKIRIKGDNMAGHVRKRGNKWYYSFEASSVGGGRTKKKISPYQIRGMGYLYWRIKSFLWIAAVTAVPLPITTLSPFSWITSYTLL